MNGVRVTSLCNMAYEIYIVFLDLATSTCSMPRSIFGLRFVIDSYG